MKDIKEIEKLNNLVNDLREKLKNNEITKEEFQKELENIKFNDGKNSLIFSYLSSKSNSVNPGFYNYITDYIVLNDIIWEREIQDLINYLKELNIKEIVVSDHSTALLRNLISFIDNGFIIENTIVYGYEKDIFGSEDKEMKGLLLKYKG